MSRHPPMSMEAVLDQERREVLALLEGQSAARNKNTSSLSPRSGSPYGPPRSPVQSMLAIAPVRSMLDVDSRATTVLSNPSSPTEPSFRAGTAHPRSLSDAGVRPSDFNPRVSTLRQDPTADYQFSGIITNNAGQALPKRVTQGGKRSSAATSMAEVMRGSDVASLVLPGDRGRHSIAGPSIHTSKSKSPHNRFNMRSMSPHNSLLTGRALSPASRSTLAGENQAQNVDYANAYKRLTDANFARSGGSLGELTRRKRSDETSGGGRLEKDYVGPNGELLPEESSDDQASSSDEEGERGRKTARRGENPLGGSHSKATDSVSPETKRKTLSLLAAAEEERLAVAARQPVHQYKSLLDEPEITVTNPLGERIKSSKPGVHPATSFDNPPRSTSVAPMDSDTEADLTDIKRAQKLSFAMTQIMSYPESHRTIQIITRGEYAKIVQEAEEEQRTVRKYLVATDMSEESTHALEWAIGTVLRDGDTLIAIYCVDEETGIGAGDPGVPDEPRAMKEQAAAINAVSASKAPVSPGGTMLSLQHHRSSPLSQAIDATSATPSPAPSRERSKAEEERHRAVHDISERVTKLLRKTRLQVRAIVEVLHCKNPRHLITEVIDIVNPTLVILGSRGRSALKGVILGSFSNYLVTKSSVPVMVARKRLRKQSKYKRLPATQQVNNISNPTARSLANAKID